MVDTRKERIIELRKAGLSYEEIGKALGISKQRAHKIVGTERYRKNSVEIESIVFEGIYELFKNDPKMTFKKLANVCNGRFFKNKSQGHATCERWRQFVTGQTRKVTINEIKNICSYIGKPFEEVFRLREQAACD